jgi:excinuclease UvrABC ATPase subunit
VDAVENLTTPVVVDQRPLGGNARSTVGTITDSYAMLRVLFARYGQPSAGQPSSYSFNDPKGMCPECEGLGRTLRPDVDLMLDRTRSLDEGAILLPGYPVGSPGWQLYARYERLDPAERLDRYTGEELHTLLHGSGGTVELTFSNGKTQRLKYEGLVDSFIRRHLKRDVGALSEKTRVAGERFLCRAPTGKLPISNVTLHNLRDVSVDVPAGVLTVVTGVAGAGKSSLISEAFPDPASRRDLRGPVADPGVVALHPGDLPGPHGPRPQAVRQGQRRRREPVQLQLEGRLRGVPGSRGADHRGRVHGPRHHPL